MMRSDMGNQMRPGMARTHKAERNHPSKVGGYERPKVAGSGQMKGVGMGKTRTKRGY